MGNVNEVTIEGFVSTNQTLSGSTSIQGSAGSISSPYTISGSTTVPKALDRTAIHYDTTEAWNSTPNLIAEKGHIYIYKDYDKKENEDGTITYVPAMKIGDGTSFLIDMPFFSAGQDEDELWNHINNWSIHVSADDRSNWTTKVSATVDERTENLLLIM